jgi:hypothetical protein
MEFGVFARVIQLPCVADKISLAPTGGSLLGPADRDLGVEGWLQTHAGAWCFVMPNGTADRTQRGGAVGGEERWDWLYDERMTARWGPGRARG